MPNFIVFDVETPNRHNHRMSAIGVSVVQNGIIAKSYYTLINPECEFDLFNTRLTGIDADKVRDAPTFPVLWQKLQPLLEQGVIVAHNATFDLGVLRKCLRDYHIDWQDKVQYLCTVQMGRKLLPGISHRLNKMAEYYGLALNHHRADSDSTVCAELLLRYMQMDENIDKYLRTFPMKY